MDEYIDRNMSLKAIDEILSKTDPKSEERIGVLKCRNAIREIEASDVSDIRYCEKCEYYNKSSSQYPCSNCRNCYTDKFKPINIDTSEF